MTDEEFYDSEIAPLLLKASELSQARGFGFVATVEYAPDSFGTTATLPANHSHAMAINLMAARSMGNFDAVAFGLSKRITQSGCGHSSMVLKLMGLPTEAANG
ncbi:hypothetical protein [Brevundimonas sp.]|uniref:hypothetical protein n=1 Tax=Brevundimonas sp. TaxID=1871086 RepID=UPI00289670B6|nr:hypothetical protein [Brevundimonas sp.]